MPPLSEEQNVVGGNFKWGNKRGTGVKNKDTQFYESFVYDGVEYFLYDSVYFYHTDHVNTSIGKLIRIYDPSWNELFLASGKSKGVSNTNELESIIGKCSVVCTSEDKRNPKPSEKELKRADFFFKCTFDVDRRVIDDKFADKIDGIEVEKFFNRQGDKKTSNNLSLETSKPPKAIKKRTSENVDEVKGEVKTKTAPSGALRCKVKDEMRNSENVSRSLKIKTRTSENVDEVKGVVKTKTAPSGALRCKVKDEVRTSENVSRSLKIKMRTSENFKDKYEVKDEVKKRKIREEMSTIGHRSNIQKKEEFDEKEELGQDGSVKPNRKVTERPNAEKRKWFKKMPWEGRLQKAQESDTLVLLTNLDPTCTSYEVEDLVWHALKEKVEARMIESSPTSNPYYGTAFVIFRTKDAAENAISELNRRCLVLEDGRVVSARKGTVIDPVKKSTFIGHLSISRAALHKQCREMRNAVSTSHCSQPNTIEYAMAIEWTQNHDQSEACWKALCEKQMKEIENVQSKLRLDKIFLEDS
ncbi:nucleic acid binding protein [Trifolium pratense]|uniref:Nucleic acid binding protein n=1 Tax=Trifolium pratense TaxID=57577 RepID=A0A2K3P8D2_TRIPR|nr:nucleic acid binding protein [Trifolium pratense]